MNATLQALGWTLIHFCWQATVISAIYLAADLWLKSARSQTRYLLTLATLSSMFFAFMATLGYEALHSPIRLPLQFSKIPVHPGVTLPVRTFTTQVVHLANGPVALHWATLLPWLDGMWMLGVVGLSIRSLGGWLWLQRLRRTTMEEAPEAIQASFQKVCGMLGITRLPKLRLSEIVPGPMTIGILRTLVLLPASALLALSPEQLEAIFAHELAHVRRADYFWNLVQTLAETLFFFHPAVWWLGKRLREQRELCCDDIAIATCPDPLVYATALFRLEDQRAAGLNLAMALDGHQSRTKFRARIMRILGEACPESHRLGLRSLSLIVVCAGLFLFLSPLPKVLGALRSHHPHKHQILLSEAIPTGKEQATNLVALGSPKLKPILYKMAEAQEPKAEATPGSGRSSVNDLMNMKQQPWSPGVAEGHTHDHHHTNDHHHTHEHPHPHHHQHDSLVT